MRHYAHIDKEAAFEKSASWEDVRAKAQAIVTYGGVEIYRDDAQEVGAYVMSGVVEGLFPVTDGGPYEVILSKRSWENENNVGGWVQAYICSCAWGSYHSGRPGGSSRWSGRMCSHSLATLMVSNARARGDFFGDRTASADWEVGDYDGERAHIREYPNGCTGVILKRKYWTLFDSVGNVVDEGREQNLAECKASCDLFSSMRTASNYDKDNFYEGTRATWAPCNAPEAEPDFVSDSGSMYWYYPEGVVRGADHWGNDIGDCNWHMLGDEHYSAWFDDNDVRYGFCPWQGFESNLEENMGKTAKSEYTHSEYDDGCYGVVYDDATFEVFDGNGNMLFDDEGEEYRSPLDAWTDMDEWAGMWGITKMESRTAGEEGVDWWRGCDGQPIYVGDKVVDDPDYWDYAMNMEWTFLGVDGSGNVLLEVDGDVLDDQYTESEISKCIRCAAGKEGKMASHINGNRRLAYMQPTTFEPDSTEYKVLSQLAVALHEQCPSCAFRVETIYFDYGQDWKWTTIVAYRDGDSWQALNPAEWQYALETGDLGTVVDEVLHGDYGNLFAKKADWGSDDEYLKGVYDDSEAAWKAEGEPLYAPWHIGDCPRCGCHMKISDEKGICYNCAKAEWGDYCRYCYEPLNGFSVDGYCCQEHKDKQLRPHMGKRANVDFAAINKMVEFGLDLYKNQFKNWQSLVDIQQDEDVQYYKDGLDMVDEDWQEGCRRLWEEISMTASKVAYPYIHIGHGSNGYTLELGDDESHVYSPPVYVDQYDLPEGLGFGDSIEVSYDDLEEYGIEIGQEPDYWALIELVNAKNDREAKIAWVDDGMWEEDLEGVWKSIPDRDIFCGAVPVDLGSDMGIIWEWSVMQASTSHVYADGRAWSKEEAMSLCDAEAQKQIDSTPLGYDGNSFFDSPFEERMLDMGYPTLGARTAQSGEWVEDPSTGTSFIDWGDGCSGEAYPEGDWFFSFEGKIMESGIEPTLWEAQAACEVEHDSFDRQASRKMANDDIQVGDLVDYYYDDFYNGKLNVLHGTYEVVDINGMSWRDSDGGIDGSTTYTLKNLETGEQFKATDGWTTSVKKHASRKTAFADTYVDLIYIGDEMYSAETHVEDSEYGVWVVSLYIEPEGADADGYFEGSGSGDSLTEAVNDALEQAGAIQLMSSDEREDYIGNLKFCVEDDMKYAGRKKASRVADNGVEGDGWRFESSSPGRFGVWIKDYGNGWEGMIRENDMLSQYNWYLYQDGILISEDERGTLEDAKDGCDETAHRKGASRKMAAGVGWEETSYGWTRDYDKYTCGDVHELDGKFVWSLGYVAGENFQTIAEGVTESLESAQGQCDFHSRFASRKTAQEGWVPGDVDWYGGNGVVYTNPGVGCIIEQYNDWGEVAGYYSCDEWGNAVGRDIRYDTFEEAEAQFGPKNTPNGKYYVPGYGYTATRKTAQEWEVDIYNTLDGWDGWAEVYENADGVWGWEVSKYNDGSDYAGEYVDSNFAFDTPDEAFDDLWGQDRYIEAGRKVAWGERGTTPSGIEYSVSPMPNPSWGGYDMSVGQAMMDNFGEVYLDTYGSPYDDEYIWDEIREDLGRTAGRRLDYDDDIVLIKSKDGDEWFKGTWDEAKMCGYSDDELLRFDGDRYELPEGATLEVIAKTADLDEWVNDYGDTWTKIYSDGYLGAVSNVAWDDPSMGASYILSANDWMETTVAKGDAVDTAEARRLCDEAHDHAAYAARTASEGWTEELDFMYSDMGAFRKEYGDGEFGPVVGEANMFSGYALWDGDTIVSRGGGVDVEESKDMCDSEAELYLGGKGVGWFTGSKVAGGWEVEGHDFVKYYGQGEFGEVKGVCEYLLGYTLYDGDVVVANGGYGRYAEDQVMCDQEAARYLGGNVAGRSEKNASKKTATRQFTYAEMKELEDEIEGTELHNADRFKDGGADYYAAI